ncbi:His-Xaa-Ser system radical SAM maturase HxsC [Pararoseomonas sp. SCSIO 73927]|uniref:His-Xaa-Ser system radical SAM maturase HxsC n=1 Tax=Pararoseomonas sp. SCSIO 73927 TaxID=3114537 RepID=UPI0030D4A8FC
MTPLALHGTGRSNGFAESSRRTLLRLRHPGDAPTHGADSALVQSAEQAVLASSQGFETSVAIDLEERGSGDNGRRLFLDGRFSHLSPGDILALDVPTGRVRVLWRAKSRHNAFLVTERCDHLCLMCSQPPRNVDDGWIIDEIRDCLPLIDPATQTVGFTGGETLLEADRFISLLGEVGRVLPRAGVHVLTNGRAFSRAEVVKAWAALRHPDLWAGIPIYSAVDTIHDHVVQSRGAFDETVLGVLRMKDAGQRVEIRVVLHALTAPRLAETCAWLARNLPFVDHVALMGMEDTGFALANHARLWMDPLDYGPALTDGVAVLTEAGIRTSIYNLPLCVLPQPVRPWAVRSISDWKNDRPEVCSPCTAAERCAGFFTTGKTKFSRGIQPIVSQVTSFVS